MHIISILGKWRKDGEFKASFGYIACFWDSLGCVRPCFNPLHFIHPQKKESNCNVQFRSYLLGSSFSISFPLKNILLLYSGLTIFHWREEILNFSNQWSLKNHIQVKAMKWCAEPAQIGQCLEDWTWTYIYVQSLENGLSCTTTEQHQSTAGWQIKTVVCKVSPRANPYPSKI